MMETERPHRTTSSSSNNSSSTTSELFICFTSRLSSSSSMKISSKSILSPGRTRETSQISLSSSLSRRLRTNGSMKGGQASPMFPANSKKRGCGFENPEPSSPKVTCIGQVRVKTKKQGKKISARSKRRGEVSFRKIDQNNNQSNNNNVEKSVNQDFNMGHLGNQFHHHQQPQECLPHRNQRWVHLPITICEALRAFGAEFNCFLPCRSSCMANQRDKEEKVSGSNANDNGNGSSCGAVFARWLVAVQEGEGKSREIELVVGEEEEEPSPMERRRRHVFEDIEIGEIEMKNGQCGDNKEEEGARVSICIPPKNALLLMRCRSDPVRMAGLANRFWEPSIPQDEEEEEEYEHEQEQEEKDTEESGDRPTRLEQEPEHKERIEACETSVSSELIGEREIPQTETIIDLQRDEGEEEYQETSQDIRKAADATGPENEDSGSEAEAEAEAEVNQTESVGESKLHGSRTEVLLDSDNEEVMGKSMQGSENELENEIEPLAEQEKRIDFEDENTAASTKQDPEEDLIETQDLAVTAAAATEEKGTEEKEEEEETVTNEISELDVSEMREPDPTLGSKDTGHQQELETETTQNQVLPDCLLLMMCEPKLSMEVSKETWVCSTDFIRWLPERPAVKKTSSGEEPKKRVSTDSKNPAQHPATTQPAPNQLLLQPPRSSCSFPLAPSSLAGAHGGSSMANMIEQKLVGGKAYEPFVLTRCKSEPMRSATKLAPDACFWKNRKLEPHRPATLGVGAAGVGC